MYKYFMALVCIVKAQKDQINEMVMALSLAPIGGASSRSKSIPTRFNVNEFSSIISEKSQKLQGGTEGSHRYRFWVQKALKRNIKIIGVENFKISENQKQNRRKKNLKIKKSKKIFIQEKFFDFEIFFSSLKNQKRLVIVKLDYEFFKINK
ncbi:hypothetical protein BpHYR1_004827 [Brachionus plicatilis]|uniref:Uncharacterized protein n=1 Tax=Brachionus plicatilis TaxID=10195 RepID=A0A3M7QLW3_BRAPC|nr:hypothetical protein BpHYR1_004827 [Brachionus plicatilis]